MNILITAGGTKEFIDGVRYLGNTSSGQTGATLADYLLSKGHRVLWLGARDAVKPKLLQQSHFFTDYDDLAAALEHLLSEQSFDVIFHAAAVSDYKVTDIESEGSRLSFDRNQKISSDTDTLQLTLTKQPKLINRLLDWSANKQLKVIGFKLTNTEDSKQQHQAVNKLLSQPGIYAVAHNDLHDLSENDHPFTLHVHDRNAFDCSDIKAVVNVLMTLWEMDQ
ncbi:MAG: NAD-dependent epimerase/dehydratase family protein [Proteobacteria bacterium]|nr:NAD-dependent epimerase/dehydratase family protein [Pseudomonadota bacterium]